MVTKGHTSGYSVWVQMKKESKNVMAYKNIGRRVQILHKNGLLEEIRLENVENLHGRKDYKVTMKGLKQLIPYLIASTPDEGQNVLRYLRKFDLDENVFKKLIADRMKSYIETVQNYRILGVDLIPLDELEGLKRLMDEFIKRPEFKDRGKQLREQLKTSSDEKKSEKENQKRKPT